MRLSGRDLIVRASSRPEPGAASPPVLVLIALAACGCQGQELRPPDGNPVARLRPNIVYIMADDLGYADLSSYGRVEYQTPALDTLADDGMRFLQAYAIAPVCTPTRVGLMTGRYPARDPTGLLEPLRFDDRGFEPQAPTLSDRLQAAGYHTGHVGKWHLGRRPEFQPGAFGFDNWFATLAGGTDYISHFATSPVEPDGPYDLYRDGREIHTDGYLTDLFTDEAEAFLRSATEPFFLNLEYNAPHWPWQARSGAPYPAGVNPITHGGSDEIYADMMSALDAGVARVLGALDALGYAENTLVIFTSDNGGERFSDMGQLRGMKSQLWEGGIRVPAFIRWPGVVAAGEATDQVATTLDWTATILAAAGVVLPSELDGIDLAPHLRGDTGVEERTVFWRGNRRGVQHAIRHGNWKYLRIDEVHPVPSPTRDMATCECLFDIGRDPGETTDLSGTRPGVLAQLKQMYAEWETTVLTPVEPL